MARPAKSMRSEIGRVRGLGSAKEGVQHWWMQRLTALALVPLGLWLVASLVCMAGADHVAIVHWLSAPFTLGVLGLLILAALYHCVLGLQVVIEDYVHTEGTKIASIILVKLAGVALAVIAIVALLNIAFAG